jgi:hypothetical protein
MVGTAVMLAPNHMAPKVGRRQKTLTLNSLGYFVPKFVGIDLHNFGSNLIGVKPRGRITN